MHILYNSLLVNEGTCALGWIAIESGKIAYIEHGTPPAEMIRNNTSENLQGCYLMPGVIDSHVHTRDPGLTHKADIATETAAAIAGGVTSIMDMPNTVPQTVTAETWEAKMRNAAIHSHTNYAFYIGATNDNQDLLATLDFSCIPGIKVFMGSSTGGMLVNSEETLNRIFSTGELVAVHCEDEAIIKRNAEEAARKYGEDAPAAMHPLIRSEEACYASSEAAANRAAELGTKLHILHISTAKELELLSKHPGITAEVCIPHLWFSDKDYERLGSRIKCNPAIKSDANREALRRAVASGVIKTVSTDHAPHLEAEKAGGALKAVSGMPMIQFSLLVMLELARMGYWDIPHVVKMMSHNQADLYGIEERGYIRRGYYADLVAVSPEVFEVSKDNILSKCRWSPLEGEKFSHRVVATWVNGVKVYKEGAVSPRLTGMPLKFKK